jgi:hypothetical protein
VDQNPTKKNLAQNPLCKIYTMHSVDTRWWQDNDIWSGIGQFTHHFQMFIRSNLRMHRHKAIGQAYLDPCDLSCTTSILLQSFWDLVEWACSMSEPNMCVIIRLWKDRIIVECILDKKWSQQICSIGNRDLKKSEGREHHISLCTPIVCKSTQDHFW